MTLTILMSLIVSVGCSVKNKFRSIANPDVTAIDTAVDVFIVFTLSLKHTTVSLGLVPRLLY